ncbi:hypothetical protein MKX03_011848 [Papaver bracteatum]|nr:hypothetical protein MKX03_011848 [Papaver bracteatum]
MVEFLRFSFLFSALRSNKISPCKHTYLPLVKIFHSIPNSGYNSVGKCTSLKSKIDVKKVAIFWDLDNKPFKSFSPLDVASRLKKMASSFGYVRYKVAYANLYALSYMPSAVQELRKERKILNQLESSGVINPLVPFACQVCGRKFYTNDKLVNHFKIHKREQVKRLNRLESSRGSRRIKLDGKLSMKMEKYKNAARDVSTPKVGYGLVDELKRAGFWVQFVSDKPQDANAVLRDHMVEMMDHKHADCVVLVSDDSDFVDVLREARQRGLTMVVVGDSKDGSLKRCADVEFSWQEIMLGKAEKEAVSVMGRWKDQHVPKRLEWSYKPESKEDESDIDKFEFENKDGDVEDIVSEVFGAHIQKEITKPWWELDSDVEDPPAKSFK